MRITYYYHYCVIGIILFVLFLPLLAIGLYAFADEWGATLLPNRLTLKHFQILFSDERFYLAFGRSLFVCFMALILSTIIILPVTFIIHYRYPSLDKWMNMIILMPFAMPPVVASVGLLQLYASSSLMGGPWILVLSYFMIALPFMYKTLSSSLKSISLPDLMNSANLMGSSDFKAFFQVILPNIKRGLFTSWFICFSFMFGEFVFANMLVGTRFETLQVYLFNMRSTSGHFTSALVMTYFTFVLIITYFAMRYSRQNDEK
ncbi:ABC transporter permease [Thorsellia anophelis]|uniref:Putative spermidine/putrescine transport system permease protein n=1 Tax=Thorsellia anophelis DSM 18579 TaxID=1123402 RepID=A0A1I0FZ56_9GAMM|nr:ABC transporter permease subunit [Thorsellia anophelis]SET62876.1 putative spermidine/putrescine transport system permease protein [Thorsellia anophelis DSM 18579]